MSSVEVMTGKAEDVVTARKRNYSSCCSSDDEEVKMRNPNIKKMEDDVLYHFALGTKSHDLKAMFGDVKFVCVGGSPRRMERFAYFMLKELGLTLPAGQTLVNIAKATDRYALYKVGPVLAASVGHTESCMASKDPEAICLEPKSRGIWLLRKPYSSRAIQLKGSKVARIGTLLVRSKQGGLGHFDRDILYVKATGHLGLEPGTVVVSDATVDALFRPYYELAILGKVVKRPAIIDKEVVDEVLEQSRPDDGFKIVSGTTMCTLDFYEGQGRLDGAFCDYTEEDKMEFLKEAYSKGVRNIEMESLCFVAMCQHAGVKCGVACVCLLDRLKGDQVTTPHETLKQWDERPATIISRIIRKHLGMEE